MLWYQGFWRMALNTSNTQNSQNSAESGARSVLTLSSLRLSCCVRDTAWSWFDLLVRNNRLLLSGNQSRIRYIYCTAYVWYVETTVDQQWRISVEWRREIPPGSTLLDHFQGKLNFVRTMWKDEEDPPVGVKLIVYLTRCECILSLFLLFLCTCKSYLLMSDICFERQDRLYIIIICSYNIFFKDI